MVGYADAVFGGSGRESKRILEIVMRNEEFDESRVPSLFYKNSGNKMVNLHRMEKTEN